MKMGRKNRLILLLISSFCALQCMGCMAIVARRIEASSPMKAYQGQDLPIQETALVKSFFPVIAPKWNKESKVIIVSVDGIHFQQFHFLYNNEMEMPMMRDSGGASTVRVPEGDHEFILYSQRDPDILSASAASDNQRRINFRTEKGHEYEIKAYTSETESFLTMGSSTAAWAKGATNPWTIIKVMDITTGKMIIECQSRRCYK